MTCKARQYSDQMLCGRCGLAWDINDDDPPECLTDEQLRRQRADQARDEAKQKIEEILR